MKYINLACMFLSFGLLTCFGLQVIQKFADATTVSDANWDHINYWASDLIIVPLIFLGLTIFCFWLAYWDYYDKNHTINKKK
ncbi:hypothetical protein [Lentilactobacillus kosonis]|uniref:Uncharacterized protein n=1 Tax=Lentilactobacillus kosonis TaxID=2810561 RepID=A0A401FM72_9LACO|nr:hypothetical protein [Lentilactobacillus kosonis]GAY73437.1 hypothetical protein NBRC111893_1583 [Lentilactobacillus kosonis]